MYWMKVNNRALFQPEVENYKTLVKTAHKTCTGPRPN